MYFDLFKLKTGKFFCNDGSRFEGEWKDDKMNGQGKIFSSLGIIIYSGTWKNYVFQV